MFNIGEKDESGRQKRIEHRGKWLRASRTGGVSLRAQTEAAGLNVTANTSRGVRVSTRLAKGTNVALQNGNFRLRGRYGKGPTKLNLSKSGVSVSTKNSLGTFNWFKPNRSSAKLFGVQVRGKKAANLQLIYMLVTGLMALIKFTVLLLIWTFQLLVVVLQYIGVGLWNGARGAGRLISGTVEAAREGARRRRSRTLSRKGTEYLHRGEMEMEAWPTARCRAALFYLLCVWGRGGAGRASDPEMADISGVSIPENELRAVAGTLEALINGAPVKGRVELIKAVTARLAERYGAAADEAERAETLFLLDEAARGGGDRTVLQDELIEVYADAAGLVFARE